MIAHRLVARPQVRLLVASPLRAWCEAVTLGVLLLALIWLADDNITTGERQNGLFVALLSAISWYSIRLRRARGAWWRAAASEVGTGLLVALAAGGLVWLAGTAALASVQQRIDEPGLMAVTGTVLRAVEYAVIRGEPVPAYQNGLTMPPVMTTMFFSGAIAFTVMRGGVHVWQFWARLRRRHLLWALTHSHMMLVVLGLFLFAVFTTINTLSYFVTTERDSNIILSVALSLIVPMLIIIGFLTVMLVVVVLPPSLVLSYFAARRTTRRLQLLTEATTRLRQGDYSTQVTVQGEDEVAALQTDFNAMAHDLERAMRDVQTERDTVATLLRNRRELVASVSHELRTPVATLRGYLESMLNRWQDRLPAELAQDIAVMETETLRLQHLLDDLFALSRVEVGELAINCQPTELLPVVRRIVSAVAPALWQTYKVELITDLPAGLPRGLVDAMRLEQVLHNLLRNAVHHTPPGGIVAINAAASGAYVLIQVKDTGEGIAPEHVPHIWERFYRAASSQAQDRTGAGLGLALVKELTEAMGGKVAVSSTVGRGSTFSVYLPRA